MNRNKGLFLILVFLTPKLNKDPRIEGVCDATNNVHPPQGYRAISKMYKRGDFYSQNSVSDIIAAHLKMMLLLFEKYYPEHEDPRGQNMWIVNPFVEQKRTAFSHEESLQIIELSSDKRLKSIHNSMSNSKFWIRMKNKYQNLHEIAMRFLLCFSTTYLHETAFSAMTVLKTNRVQVSDCLHLAIT